MSQNDKSDEWNDTGEKQRAKRLERAERADLRTGLHSISGNENATQLIQWAANHSEESLLPSSLSSVFYHLRIFSLSLSLFS